MSTVDPSAEFVKNSEFPATTTTILLAFFL